MFVHALGDIDAIIREEVHVLLEKAETLQV